MELPFGILNRPILPMRSVRKLIREVKFDLEENDTASEEPRIAGVSLNPEQFFPIIGK